jgi:hypothetical protein
MNSKALLGALAALTLVAGFADPVSAQSRQDPESRQTREPTQEAEESNSSAFQHLRSTETQRPRRGRRAAPAPAAPAVSAEEAKATVQTQLTAAGIACDVTEATLVGVDAEQQPVFEAVCASGSGYLALTTTPPQAFNCLELAGQAETSRMRDPEAAVGQQCTLPANQNGLAVIGGFAREAGLACTVDQAGAIGKNTAGGLVYEVGCAEAKGYWVERAENGWKTTPCWDLAFSNITCRYTTAAEVLASWQGVLAGSSAAACDVQAGRRVGRDAQGLTVYELKCGAGDGYFVRVDADWKAQQFQPCTAVQHIAGGCTLTTVPAAAPAAAEQ